jgi:small subunit ribosomal protein S9
MQVSDTATEPQTILATGRRKRGVARVRLKPNGSGQISVNKRPFEEYFQREQDRIHVLSPLHVTGALKKYDIVLTLHGGGMSGQAGAARHGLSRALCRADPAYFPPLKEGGYLTRDARQVERKKPGKKGARASYQFSKR